MNKFISHFLVAIVAAIVGIIIDPRVSELNSMHHRLAELRTNTENLDAQLQDAKADAAKALQAALDKQKATILAEVAARDAAYNKQLDEAEAAQAKQNADINIANQKSFDELQQLVAVLEGHMKEASDMLTAKDGEIQRWMDVASKLDKDRTAAVLAQQNASARANAERMTAWRAQQNALAAQQQQFAQTQALQAQQTRARSSPVVELPDPITQMNQTIQQNALQNIADELRLQRTGFGAKK